MNFIQAILMGIVQGLSEFLPISSSAHLVFTSNFYKVFKGIEIVQQSNEEVFFDIMVHLGTLIAVLIFFRKDIAKICVAMWQAVKTKDWSSHEAKLGLYIILGTFVTLVLALPLNEVAEKLVYSPAIVGMLLFVTGFVLLLSEHMSKKVAAKKDRVDLKTSVLIGLAQGLAALPGFSRSGWTIATGLFSGLDRTTAARYSFLLSIPIILGASMAYPMLEMDFSQMANFNYRAIFWGFMTSFIVGYLCVKYFMKLLGKVTLKCFSYYCFVVGALMFLLFSICHHL